MCCIQKHPKENKSHRILTSKSPWKYESHTEEINVSPSFPTLALRKVSEKPLVSLAFKNQTLFILFVSEDLRTNRVDAKSKAWEGLGRCV